MIRFVCILLLLAIISCKGKTNNGKPYNVRSDIRLGTKFYSIFLNREGRAYVIKGKGSYYTDTLKIEASDTSSTFKLDSVKIFFESLNKIRTHPIFKMNRTGTAPRAEVYYEGKKVYDAYEWDETFWDLFRPIMEQIPQGYNPFRSDDKPFEN
jgi:hypothetical protein